MSEIDSIIQITITRETTTVATASFNIPLILADFTNFSERTRSYTDFDAIAADFNSSSNVYKMAQRLFGQDAARPPSVVIGRRQIDSVDGSIPVVATGRVYTVTINGTPYSYTAAGGNTATQVATGIKTQYNLAPKAGITFTDNLDGTFNVSPAVEGANWSITSNTNVALVNDTPTESWSDALDAVIDDNNEWYALTAEVHTKDEQLELA